MPTQLHVLSKSGWVCPGSLLLLSPMAKATCRRLDPACRSRSRHAASSGHHAMQEHAMLDHPAMQDHLAITPCRITPCWIIPPCRIIWPSTQASARALRKRAGRYLKAACSERCRYARCQVHLCVPCSPKISPGHLHAWTQLCCILVIAEVNSTKVWNVTFACGNAGASPCWEFHLTYSFLHAGGTVIWRLGAKEGVTACLSAQESTEQTCLASGITRTKAYLGRASVASS